MSSLKKYKELDQDAPLIVKISGDQTTAHLPSKLVQESLLLHSIVPHKKIICQCVEFASKDGQLYFSHQRFSIPLGYTGWFEILSEDGKTIPPCKTIEQLAQQAPEQFLIRSKVKAYLSEKNGNPDYDKMRFVNKGEVITIVGQLNITIGWRKQKKQILHCMDSHGLDIYFDFKTTGQFSPMAGKTNISGVHNVDGLLSQFRLPLTVRIVSGQIPRVASENDRPGVFRLIETQKDNTALFLPIKSHQKLIPVSVRTNLLLKQSNNMAELSHNNFYQTLKNLADTKVEKYFKTMQVLVSARQQQKSYSACTLPARSKAGNMTHIQMDDMQTEEDILFAEVDDLYAYVRRGGIPPKPRPRSWATNPLDISTSTVINSELKSSSQPTLSASGKPRGLLATLTAGKFPSKASSGTLIRQYRVSNSTPTFEQTKTFIVEGTDSAAVRDELKRTTTDRYRDSAESLQMEVDPYVDEGQYQPNTEQNKRDTTLPLSSTEDISNSRVKFTRNENTRLRFYSGETIYHTIESPVSPTRGKMQVVSTNHDNVSHIIKLLGRPATYHQQSVQAT